MKAYIYTGGKINAEMISERPGKDDLVIAADSGYISARRMGVKVDLLVGDFDSMPEPETKEELEIIKLKPEKDLTDTQAALELALARGADEIVIIGGLEGRLDHALSTLSLLEYLHAKKIRRAYIHSGYNRASFLRNDSTILLRTGYKYFSLIAADKKVSGVEIKGAKYPLERAKLTREHQFAVSNEIEGNCAFISVARGGVYIIESNDV